MPRILVFLHGTALMHSSAEGRPRDERVAQVRERDPSVRDFDSYIPVGDAVAKLGRWAQAGATIAYLSSHRDPAGVETDRAVLARHGFPPGEIFGRRDGEGYAEVVARAAPDVLVEDDCESIGEEEIAWTQLDDATRARVRSYVVPEFGGIDHLPDDVRELAAR